MADHTPDHHYQASLKDVIDSSIEPPLDAGERIQAKRRFLHIVNHFEGRQQNSNRASARQQYNQPALVRLTYEYSLSEESRDLYLRAFFRFMTLSVTGENIDFSDKHLEDMFCSSLMRFADYLIDNFFLPSLTGKTPQLSPAHNSAFEYTPGGKRQFGGTPERQVKSLRDACLVRDHHRCVVSRKFDHAEAASRGKKYGLEAEDDDGAKLVDETNWGKLEVAHILPQSLTQFTKEDEMSESRKATLTVLDMFDRGVGHLIKGPVIDQPQNALTLEAEVHDHFSNFSIYFTPVEGAREANTYRIDSFLPPFLARGRYPVTRTLLEVDGNIIDAPLPRFLAIHRAIAHILHFSAVREYIDRILRDMEAMEAREDGSTDLGSLVERRLRKWVDAPVDA